jgi:penicillin-binding protein 2
MVFKKQRKIQNTSFDPDQILFDAKNTAGFNTQQFEGVLEKTISKRSLTIFGIIISILLFGCAVQLFRVQIMQGQKFFTLSENNRLHQIPIFSERGVVFDRNNIPLAWNIPAPQEDEPFLHRQYIEGGGFGHLLGYVGYPTRDTSGFFWRESVIGKAGIEKKYSDYLSGQNGSKIVQVDAMGNITSENMMIQPVLGKNLVTTIDSTIQTVMYNAIKKHAQDNGFQGGAGIIMNIKTGELIAMTSYPEFDANILSQGKNKEIIQQYALDDRKVYLNRAINGLFTPGSIVKPYLAIGALQEGIITPQTTVFSSGKVEIPNRYDPSKPQVFRDWKKGGHGPTNVYTAIAESVNTFFYAIGGGYRDQQGLGISRIDTYIKKFGIGDQTDFSLENDKQGTVPSPEWKLKNFKDGAWRQGDTYNSAIGQFGFQVSLLQIVRAVGAIGNGGILITPHIEKDQPIKDSEKRIITDIDAKNFTVIRDAMRQTVLRGTASTLNVPYIQVSAKTGTAQTGKGNKFMNSWSTGFFPSNDPTYAFVVVMEMAPSTNEAGASRVVRSILDQIQLQNPNFFITN